jgi:serine/threonine protein kinase
MCAEGSDRGAPCPTGGTGVECDIESALANRYHLLTRLGEGGMAEVWLAHDSRLDVRRAVKILDPNLHRNAKIRARFDAEARAMARIVHPNVVTVHDVGEDGDRSFIVMELVHGGSLAEKVRTRGPLPPRIAAELLAAVLDALDTAHALGIVHRDIKPHNILLTADGVPKLTDFGIAQIDAGKQSLTRTGSVMGTIPYMSPEQKQDSKSVGPAADVYGIGATLYHVVTGAEPYDLYVEQVRKQVLAGLYAEVAEIIDRATRYDPKDRYRTASEMRGALLGCIPRLPFPPIGLTAWMGSPNTAIAAPSFGDPTGRGTPAGVDTVRLAPGDANTVNFDSAPPSSTRGPASPPPAAAANPANVDTVLNPASVATVVRADNPVDALLEAAIAGPPPARVDPAPPAPPPQAQVPPGPDARPPSLAFAAVAAALLVALPLALLGGAFVAGAGPFASARPVAVAPLPVPVAPDPAPAATTPEPTEPAPPEPGPRPPVAPASPVAPVPPPPVAPARPSPAPLPTPAPVEPVAPAPVAPSPAPEPVPVPVPAPPPAGPQGTLKVGSLPRGASVSIDGVAAGTTPLSLPVAVGTHLVGIEQAGATTKTIKLAVQANGTTTFCWDFGTGAPCPK